MQSKIYPPYTTPSTLIEECGEWCGFPKFGLGCDGCIYIPEEYRKGDKMSPFPKDVQRPGDIPELPILHKVEDFNNVELLLKEHKIKENEQYGNGIVLFCETADQLEVQILTFSEVIRDQLVALGEHLPVIIKPVSNGTYYTIY